MMADVIIDIEDETNLLGGEGCRTKEIATLSGFIADDHIAKVVDAIRAAYPQKEVRFDVSRVETTCESIHKSGGVGLVNWPHEKGWSKGGGA